MTTERLAVDGLGCSGCVKKLTESLAAVEGVTDVDVTLVPGGTSTVVVRADRAVGRSLLEAAVTRAGKRLAQQSVDAAP